MNECYRGASFMKSLYKLLIFAGLFLSVASVSHANVDYCVGIRGNGQNAPAHWPALGRLVEELGMPKMAAGGSSATISMFLLDSIAGNPTAGAQPEARKNAMQGLLLKSLPAYVAVMANEHHWGDIFALLKTLSDKNSDLNKKLDGFLKTGTKAEELQDLFGRYQGLVNPELLRLFTVNPVRAKVIIAEAAKVFGSFDAKNDANLFFRPGLVDFKYFSLMIGQIADFYSEKTSAEAKEQLSDFLNSCASDAKGKFWTDISPSCQGLFARAVSTHLKQPIAAFQNASIFNAIGKNIEVLPTTAVVTEAAKKRYETSREEYFKGNESVVPSFSFNFSSELGFGYWGKGNRSQAIAPQVKALFPEDAKSSKFVALGEATWFDVLSTSPAEPGLTNFQQIPTGTSLKGVLTEATQGFQTRWAGLNYRKDYLSVGGWSDLHPTLVLRAAGCENVVYLQRQGGDTVFGQQVFIRLTGTQNQIPFWDHIGDNNLNGWNVKGTAAENTPWNALYNMANPSSSYLRSIKEANAVFCTNWNAYEPFAGQTADMARDSYQSPVLVRSSQDRVFDINPNGVDPVGNGFIGCR